ncbi:MAG: manganese efflux pump [Spirochaetota bacterium]|nr:manganese efflux pump [Spirochaetota bacterium]
MAPIVITGIAFSLSFDAFAVGISFAVLHYPILIPALVIGIITFVMSTIGLKAGSRLYVILEDKVEYAGEIILILIGVKILIEHLS